MLAEFGYWIITSAWNIQREWGPFDTATGEPHAEWKLVDRAAMERELPSALALLARTADRVLVPPTSDATPATPHLAGLGCPFDAWPLPIAPRALLRCLF